MMEQLTIDSFTTQVMKHTEPETKEEAIERGMEHANAAWKTAAFDTIVEIAQKQPTFTSDDVLASLERLDVQTHDTRVLGGILTQAARLKWIRKSGNYVPSVRKVCHSRPILVWESLLFPSQA